MSNEPEWNFNSTETEGDGGEGDALTLGAQEWENNYHTYWGGYISF